MSLPILDKNFKKIIINLKLTFPQGSEGDINTIPQIPI